MSTMTGIWSFDIIVPIPTIINIGSVITNHITSWIIRHIMRYRWMPVLAPLHVFAQRMILTLLYESGMVGWRMAVFWSCTAASVVFSSLIEPRYCIVPITMLIQNIHIPEQLSARVYLYHMLINSGLLYLLFSPFRHKNPMIW